MVFFKETKKNDSWKDDFFFFFLKRKWHPFVKGVKVEKPKLIRITN